MFTHEYRYSDSADELPLSAPYTAIHVGAAAPTMPQDLIDQLDSPGRMFIPVGTHEQAIWKVDKDAQGKVTKEMLMGVRVSGSHTELSKSGL